MSVNHTACHSFVSQPGPLYSGVWFRVLGTKKRFLKIHDKFNYSPVSDQPHEEKKRAIKIFSDHGFKFAELKMELVAISSTWKFPAYSVK